MYRKSNLILTLLFLILVVASLMTFSYFFMPHFSLPILFLIVLAMLSAVFMSDLMVSWTVLFSIAIGTVILVAGVVYIPLFERSVLIFSFPLVLGISNQILYHNHLRRSSVKDERGKASDYYKHYLEYNGQKPLQAYLVHWAHNKQFEHINSREYRRILGRIQYLLQRNCGVKSVFYVSNGNFLIFSDDETMHFGRFFQGHVLPMLEAQRFRNTRSIHHIQYQKGYLLIHEDNLTQYPELDDVLKKLYRQLETDIIVEY